MKLEQKRRAHAERKWGAADTAVVGEATLEQAPVGNLCTALGVASVAGYH